MSLYSFHKAQDTFAQLFENEKLHLESVLPENVQIFHIGSTAVPGLGGKGVIDIALVAPDQDKLRIWEALDKASYQLRPDYSPAHHVSHTRFDTIDSNSSQKYQILPTTPNSDWLNNVLLFRNYLRTHPQAVQEYETIKKNALLHGANQKSSYVQYKKSFIERIISLA